MCLHGDLPEHMWGTVGSLAWVAYRWKVSSSSEPAFGAASNVSCWLVTGSMPVSQCTSTCADAASEVSQ